MKWSKRQLKMKLCHFFFFSSQGKKKTSRAHVPEMFLKFRLLWSVLEAPKLKDTFDRRPASWWICSLRFTGGCGDPACQHKVNGCGSLTAHQSSQMFLIFYFFFFIFFDPTRRHSQIITAPSLADKVQNAAEAACSGRSRCEAAVWLVTLLRNSRRVEGDEGKGGKKQQKRSVCVCVFWEECKVDSACAPHRRTLSLQPLHFLRVTPYPAPHM